MLILLLDLKVYLVYENKSEFKSSNGKDFFLVSYIKKQN